MATRKEETMETIRLGNQDFAVERREVDIGWLKLDPKNQRLSYQLAILRKEGKGNTDQELHDLLWSIDAVKSLFNSVLQNGGLIEDPFVKTDGLVVEGNSRTVVIRELHKKFPRDERFAKLYVKILPADATEEQIVSLLGEMHVAGKIKWGAYEEAEYVWRMNKEFAKTYDFLATYLRMSRSKISQKIAAYEETKTYLAETNDPDGIRRFSHFEEFMKKTVLRERRGNDPDFMKEFRKWVLEGKFPDSKDVRSLPEILDNSKSLEVLARPGGTVQTAISVLNNEDPSRNSDLYYAVDLAIRQLRTIPLAEIKDLQAGNDTKIAKLQDLYEALKEVAAFAKLHFSED